MTESKENYPWNLESERVKLVTEVRINSFDWQVVQEMKNSAYFAPMGITPLEPTPTGIWSKSDWNEKKKKETNIMEIRNVSITNKKHENKQTNKQQTKNQNKPKQTKTKNKTVHLNVLLVCKCFR